MARFQIKCFGHEAVVFDSSSGDTHYLSPLAYAIYTTSRDQPGIRSHDIPATLGLLFDIEPDASFIQLTDEAVSTLHHIGLLGLA